MPRREYEDQVRLLVSALPFVDREPCFALKGGTALNLFVRDFPRLSVDIDLTYLPVAERDASLTDARAALRRIGNSIESGLGARVRYEENQADGLLLQVQRHRTRIKIEVNPVLRGCVRDPVRRDICAAAESEFGFASVQMLDPVDLYGGKICAALDRQHPRDLYDVMLLLDDGPISRDIIDGFLVYLISHSRPIRELLAPRFKDIRQTYDDQFSGMTREAVSCGRLEQARVDLLTEIRRGLTPDDCDFLISFKRGEPDWPDRFGARIATLPGVRWKLQNIRKMKPDAHAQAVSGLQDVLAKHHG